MIFISYDETFNVKVVHSESSSHGKTISDENCFKKPLAQDFLFLIEVIGLYNTKHEYSWNQEKLPLLASSSPISKLKKQKYSPTSNFKSALSHCESSVIEIGLDHGLLKEGVYGTNKVGTHGFCTPRKVLLGVTSG